MLAMLHTVDVYASQAMCSVPCSGGIMFPPCLSRCPEFCPVSTGLQPAGLAVNQPCLQQASHVSDEAVGQNAVRAGESIPVPIWTVHFRAKNGTVSRAGESIIHMLLRRHQMIAKVFISLVLLVFAAG